MIIHLNCDKLLVLLEVEEEEKETVACEEDPNEEKRAAEIEWNFDARRGAVFRLGDGSGALWCLAGDEGGNI